MACPLASPREKHLTHRRGALYYYIPNGRFLHISISCSSARGSFLVLSVAGHARDPRECWVQVWALAEVRGTCSGVQSSENWQITTGLNSDDLEPTRPIETRNNQIIFKEKEHHICRVCCNPSHHHHHHQHENEPRAAVAAVVVQAFKYGTAPPPQPPSAPSSTDYSFLTLHGWRKSQNTILFCSYNCVSCKATTSADFSKPPRRQSNSTEQHSSTAAVVQQAAASVQALAFVTATTVLSVCRTHIPQLAGHPARS